MQKSKIFYDPEHKRSVSFQYVVLNIRGREFWSNCRFVNILFWKSEHDSNVCVENEISELNFTNINQAYRTQNSCPLKNAVVCHSIFLNLT